MDNESKAKYYDQLLREYDVKAREVSVIQGKFDLERADHLKIKELKKDMAEIQFKASTLGSL